MSLIAPAELNSELDELEQNVQPTWEGLLHPYERIQDRLSKTWGAVSHLKVRVAAAWNWLGAGADSSAPSLCLKRSCCCLR